MPPKAVSAGILLYRAGHRGVQILLVHPGGPYWRHRDEGAWQIPKGMIEAGESPAGAALREFGEELGSLPSGELRQLGCIRQAGGKMVEAFAVEGDLDERGISCTSFELKWPPRSGRRQSFPEIDRAAWFSIDEARPAMLPSQCPLLDRLMALLGAD